MSSHGGRDKKLSSSVRALIPLMMAPPSKLHHPIYIFQSSHLLMPSHWWSSINIYILGPTTPFRHIPIPGSPICNRLCILQIHLLFFFFLRVDIFLFSALVLGREPRTSGMPSILSTTQLQFQPLNKEFFFF